MTAMREKRQRRAGKSGRAEGLSPKRRIFALEYLVDLNATQAAIRAGYGRKNADVNGPRLLGDAGVRAFVDEQLRKRAEALELTAARIDRERARVALLDPAQLFDESGNLLPVRRMPEDARRAIASVKLRTVKVVHGKAAQAAGDALGVSDQARGVEDGARPVEEITLGTVEVKLAPKITALADADYVLGRRREKVEVSRRLSHEQILLLAERIRARRLAERAAASRAAQAPTAPARARSR
jgi:hypothetical protein